MEWRQAVEAIEGRLKQLAQGGKRHVGLEFDAASREHPHRSGLLDRVLEEGGLPDSGLSADDKARALAQPRRGQALIDREKLTLSSEQHRVLVLRVSRRRGGLRPTTRWPP